MRNPEMDIKMHILNNFIRCGFCDIQNNQGRGKTLIILDITKNESNNCFIKHRTNAKIWKSCFYFFTDGKQHESRKVDMVTLGNHALRSYMT